MKQVVFVIISISLFACATKDDKKEKENLAVAKKYMEAVETKNVATMDSLLAESYIGYGPSVGDSTNKKDALATWKYNAENLYESFEYTRHKELAVSVTEGEAQGDWVLNYGNPLYR